MNLETMYSASVNSKETRLSEDITETATEIFVTDGSILPDAPNLLVIGGNSDKAETVKLLSKDGDKLTVERGFQGDSIAWKVNTIIGRNFTAYDHDTFKNNIENLNTEQSEHLKSKMPHLTSDGKYKYGFKVNDDESVSFIYEEQEE